MEGQAVPAGAVVVGHDGSPHAERALRAAIGYAEAFGAPLVIVRAWQLDADVPAYTRILASDPGLADLAVDVRASLADDCRDALSGHPGLAVEQRAELGAPADILSSLSGRARLLVLGSRGRGGVAGLLLGSVTARCLHQASCPVLVIRDEPTDAGAAAVRSDAGADRPLPRLAPGTVVVGNDGSPGSEQALETAIDFARAIGAPVAVVRCWSLDDMPPGLLWKDGYVVSFDDASETIRTQLDRAVAPVLARHPDVEVHCHGVHGDSGSTLVAVSAEAALLVVGTRGRGGFRSLLLGSVSAYCAHRAACPTLVVPRRATAGQALRP